MIYLIMKNKDGQPVKNQFDQDIVRIGRAIDNDLFLQDVSISRHHCEIRKENNLYFVYDLQSLNGTYVNGQHIKRASLQNNDLLRIGNVESLVQCKFKGKGSDQSDYFLINKVKGVEVLQALSIQSFQDISMPGPLLEPSIETLVEGVTHEELKEEEDRSYKQELHRLRRAYRHLLFSYGLTSSISTIESREEFLSRLVKSLFIAFEKVERAYVTGYASSTESFPIYAEECAPGFESVDVPLCHPALLLSMTDRKALCAVNSLDKWPALPEEAPSPPSGVEPMRSIMCVPLISQNETLGVLYLENFTKPQCFDDVDLELLCVISVLSATAMKNIELYGKITRAYDDAYQKFHEQLSLSTTLCELGRALTSTVEEEDIIRRIIPMLREQMGIRWFGVGLFRESHKRGNCKFFYSALDGDASKPIKLERKDTALQRTYLANFVKDTRILSISDLRRETSPFVPIIRNFPEQSNYCVFAPLIVKKETMGFLVLAVDDAAAIRDNQVSFVNGAAYQAALAFETARLFASLKEQQTQLRQLSNQIIAAQEQERKRLARELHDDIGQIFSAIRLHVESLSGQALAPPGVKAVETLKDLATHGMDELRHISLNLRPPMLDDLGLMPTLNWFAKDYAGRYSINVKIQNEANIDEFDKDFETNLFRIIQEALNNVAKHAQAKNVLIIIREQAGHLEVRIVDDGKGFSIAEQDETKPQGRRGFGLLNMKERGGTFSGSFEIQSKPQSGTTLKFLFPLGTIRATTPAPSE